jgi:leader peptidase (prepilin peptidase)/N-methyltransferase
MTTNLMLAISTGMAVASPFVMWFDIKERRIPNRITLILALYAVMVGVGVFISTDDVVRLIQAAALSVIAAASFAAILWLAPGSIGMGDVKFVVVVAFLLGLASPAIFVYAMLATAVIGGVWGIVQLMRHNLDVFAYGPSIVLGVWVGIFIGFQSAF